MSANRSNRAVRALLALALSSLMLFPAVSGAVWNKDWKVRREVRLDTSATGLPTKGALSSVPVVIRLHSGNFDFTSAKPDGSDLRVIGGDDKTPLKFHVERFDSVNELAVLWVAVPQLMPGTDKGRIFLYAGNEAAQREEDAKGSFDAATAAVLHFDEAAPTRNLLDGANATGSVQIEKAGLLGAAGKFSGEPIVLAASPALRLAPASGFTFSAWIRPAAAGGSLYRQGAVELKLDGGKLVLSGTGLSPVSGGNVRTDAWQHVAATVGGGKATLYLDGEPVAEASANLGELQEEVRLGAGYTGLMDEVEIASAPRGAEWVRVAALSQGAEAKLVTLAAEAEVESGSTSYFGILVSNLTPDAWVVIGILMAMFVVAVVVMVGKARFVARVDAANRRFLKQFRDADDFLAIGKTGEPGALQRSSLFHLYKTGVREIEKRFAHASVGAAAAHVLTGASIDAIKASIDADMVRENHRLNSQMVLLTIAISGGPFLGLLGTVVGVMITFAAIAAAGDVNVNSIAPGIAAALLATVAGLGVAIPSLFGYNWLASRIKNITADQQIFVDEFVTRAAEQYAA